jgi:hypothetical protein
VSLRRQYADLQARYQARVAADETQHETAEAEEYALARVAAELDRCKEVVASHIVAAGHPSTVLQSPQQFAESLRQSLADAGVDLRLELARLEGGQL